MTTARFTGARLAPGTSTAEPDAVGGGGPGSVRLSEYALGKIGEIVPADACRIAPAGSNVLFDIHYYPNGKEIVRRPLVRSPARLRCTACPTPW